MKNSKNFYMMLRLMLVSLMIITTGCKAGQFSVDIKVIDGDGKAIESVEVSSLQGERKLSNSKGLATLAFKKVIKLTTSATKKGYYGSGAVTFSGHKPPKEVTIVLKKIKNPIAMYAKSLLHNGSRGLTIPGELGDRLGYDLMVGDWVAPFGKGRSSDFIFKKEKGAKGQKITVTFSHKKDGIIPFEEPLPLYEQGEYRSFYVAPLNGYLNSWEQVRFRKIEKPTEHLRKRERNYYFRVRTQVDENGKIKSAHYGKIYGDFMDFIYYLNPTPNDRNVEFDPKKNLFKNLPEIHEVNRP